MYDIVLISTSMLIIWDPMLFNNDSFPLLFFTRVMLYWTEDIRQEDSKFLLRFVLLSVVGWVGAPPKDILWTSLEVL